MSAYGPHDAYEPEEPHAPRHRKGTRLALVLGGGLAALLVVGLIAFGGTVLFGGLTSSSTDSGVKGQGAVAGDATGDVGADGSADAGGMGAPQTEGATASPPPSPAATTTAPSKPAKTTPGKPKTTGPVYSGNEAYEREVLAIVNVERAKKNCKPLAYNAKLTTAARRHSQDMAAKDYFSHTSQDGTDFATRMSRAGYQWSGAAENIAKGQRTPADVMNAWMNSSGHRANILNCGLKDLGVGLAYRGKTPFWTQDFGSPR